MGYLAINTASLLSQIVLLNKERILGEKKWKSDNNESEKLMPEIQKLLEENGVKFEDIEKVIVITGPGPFTALRVSIALVNALAYGLNKPVVGISTVECWKLLFNGELVLNAGGNRVYYNGEIIDFDDLLKLDFKNKEISGEIKEEQIQKLKELGLKWINREDLTSFGNIVLDLAKKDFKGYDEKEIIAPLYFSAPQITKSTKSYK